MRIQIQINRAKIKRIRTPGSGTVDTLNVKFLTGSLITVNDVEDGAGMCTSLSPLQHTGQLFPLEETEG